MGFLTNAICDTHSEKYYYFIGRVLSMNQNQKGQEVKRLKEKDLENIRKYLGEINKVNFLNFINIGVNVGLRISDLAQLRFEMINHN